MRRSCYQRLVSTAGSRRIPKRSYQFSNVTREWTKDEYVARFERVQEKIRAGDIYQLNLTFKARSVFGFAADFLSGSAAAPACRLWWYRRYR